MGQSEKEQAMVCIRLFLLSQDLANSQGKGQAVIWASMRRGQWEQLSIHTEQVSPNSYVPLYAKFTHLSVQITTIKLLD